MLMTMSIPSYVGESKPIGNVGDMENSGLEFELGYKWNVADAKFAVKGNASYLKNKLLQYGNDTGYANLDSFQGVGTITRAENGHPFPFFYGYKTAGIFQNVAEVQAYRNADGGLIQPDAVPGTCASWMSTATVRSLPTMRPTSATVRRNGPSV
jgi:hypothetical protein